MLATECEATLMFVKRSDGGVEARLVPPRRPRTAPPNGGATDVAGRGGESPPRALRRTPTQSRGRARVEAILDAAEVVFAEAGYENATTEAIAQRAGASIGSLYQFFPNKRALFEAVSARYLASVRDLFDGTIVAALPGMPWEDVLDMAIDAFWAASTSSPAFSAIWLQGRITRQLIDAGYALNRVFADRAEELLVRYAPELPKKRRAVVATMIVETVSAMLFVAVRLHEPAGDGQAGPPRKKSAGPSPADELIGETKRMLRAYVRDALGEPR